MTSLVASVIVKFLSVSSTTDSVAHTSTIPSPSPTVSMAGTDTDTSVEIKILVYVTFTVNGGRLHVQEGGGLDCTVICLVGTNHHYQ